MVRVVKLALRRLQTLEFASVDSSRVEEHLLIVILLWEHWGGVESAIKVVMVIMTFDGTPTCFVHRFSTGEIIFWVGD